MTTISVSMVTSSAFSTTVSTFVDHFTVSRPALVTASSTAAMMASEVLVAPATASTFAVCCSTMRPGICATAGSEMPAVSPFLVTSMAVTAPFSSTVTATSMAPLPPISLSPTPVKTPASALAAPHSVSSIVSASRRERNFFMVLLLIRLVEMAEEASAVYFIIQYPNDGWQGEMTLFSQTK